MSSPFLPMTMPGRAVWNEMRASVAGRSISMRLTDACEAAPSGTRGRQIGVADIAVLSSCPRTKRATSRWTMPRRIRSDLLFDPSSASSASGRVRHDDGDVARAFRDPIAAALGARAESASASTPSSTMISMTLSSSMSAPSLCSAFAIADSRTFLTTRAPFLLLKSGR